MSGPQIPHVTVGTAEQEPEMDDTVEGIEDDSDDELETTPPDVVEMLGFDPLELKDNDNAPNE